MKPKSSYTISDGDKEREVLLIVHDEDPLGVTIEIQNNYCFNLPRIQMIEALEYILNKLKTTIS